MASINKKKVVRVTPEEYEALQVVRNAAESEPVKAVANAPTSDYSALVAALTEAIQATRPPEKKTVFTRKSKTPWSPPEGTPRAKMKRKMHQHGIPISDRVTNEEINLMNKVRPGVYCEGVVKVTLRKDRGVDIDYPVKTASQRLRLVNQFGIRNFQELLERIVDEQENPTKYKRPEDLDW